MNSAVAETGDRLATIDMGQKVEGAAVPFSVGELRRYLTQFRQGRDLPPYHVASPSIQPFGHNTPTLQTDSRTGQRSHSIG